MINITDGALVPEEKIVKAEQVACYLRGYADAIGDGDRAFHSYLGDAAEALTELARLATEHNKRLPF